MKIAELKPGMRGVNLIGKIQEISAPRHVTTRFGGMSRVADAILSDESGAVRISLWNEQIDQVRPGDSIKVENGYVTSFRGEAQLNVGRYGKLSVLK
ncbi:MAG: OB-fold nucleic acid binding domain-containing protein [Candidatus Bathyarchaeia archaeon]